MIKLYRSSAAARFWLRQIAFAIVSFFVSATAQGSVSDWHNFLWGLAGAVATALLGLLTPLEPFVGVKAKRVEVPQPPAVPDR